MKMYYTQAELAKLSPEKILELTTFGGGESVYYYSDLDKLQSHGTEFSFHFKDKSVIYTQQEDTYNEVKVGKARFDLLGKSIEGNKEQDEREKAFYAELMEMVGTQIQNLTNATQNFETNADIAIKTVGEQTGGQMQQITTRLNTVAERWDEQMNALNTFDVKAYNVKMTKIDKIIDAFDKLLEA